MRKILLLLSSILCFVFAGCGILAESVTSDQQDTLSEVIANSIKETKTITLSEEYLKVKEMNKKSIHIDTLYDKEAFVLDNHYKISYKDEQLEKLFSVMYKENYTGVAALDIFQFISLKLPDISQASIGDSITLQWEINEEKISQYFGNTIKTEEILIKIIE